MASVGSYGYKRDAVRVKVMKYDGTRTPESRKFSVDPQITSFEVLQSILAKAFEVKGEFTVCYKFLDDYGQETYLALLSDWDLDAAFISASEPYLDLRVDVKPPNAANHQPVPSDDWETPQGQEIVGQGTDPILEIRQAHKLPAILMNKMGRTLNSVVQRAFNLAEEHGHVLYNTHNQLQHQLHQQPEVSSVPPRPPLTDAEFRKYLDPIGQVIRAKELRSVIYLGGIEPSLRKVVWKHLLNVYPEGMSGKERMDYMKRKAAEYRKLRDSWKEMYKNDQMVGDLAYVTGMVKKDVLRTDRHHVFYGGSDDNKNIAALFNILTTYALNHPTVSYCQGMSDLASPLLVTMNDEAHAYICFCGLMQRLAPNFLLDGITMTKRFQHLADGLLYYDPSFYNYLKLHQADDLLFCYRWLLLEMKREFAFDEALRMLEVMWSSVTPFPPDKELPLYQKEFCASPLPISPRPRETPYTKVCALIRQRSSASLSLDGGLAARDRGCARLARQSKTRPYASMDESQLTTRTPANSELTEAEKSSARVVKNLNEFLSFDKNNALRIGRKYVGGADDASGDKMKNSENNLIEEENSQDDTATNDLCSYEGKRLSSTERERKTSGKRLIEDQSSLGDDDDYEDFNNFNNGDESSPNDDSSSEIYPSVTTSMTHELRLELESLDRQVFSNNEKQLPTSFQPNGSVVNNAGGDDVFIWENPLRNSSSRRSTPDEQVDLEYDANNSSSSCSSSPYNDVFKSEENSVKSAPPLHVTKSSPAFRKMIVDTTISGEKNRVVSESSCDVTKTSQPLLERRKVKLDEIITNAISTSCSSDTTSPSTCGGLSASTTANNTPLVCDSPNGVNCTNMISSNGTANLPPPDEFGGGNPFLMFLCITVLQQHRDLIMNSGMDYNEMAMHFDKMVRKHNVTKVLNQARMMYAEYMKQHNANLTHLII